MEEIPKPFGYPDERGFHKVIEANEVPLKMAQILVASDGQSLEYLALSGFIDRDYPEGTEEKDYDWKYHLLVGVDPNASEDVRKAIQDLSFTRRFEEAYKEALGKMYWHHGLVKPVILDYHKINEDEIRPGTLHFSLIVNAVPLWEKPEISKPWGQHTLSPFEHLQQYFLQFHDRPKVAEPDYVYVIRVTGDEAKRYVIPKEND